MWVLAGGSFHLAPGPPLFEFVIDRAALSADQADAVRHHKMTVRAGGLALLHR